MRSSTKNNVLLWSSVAAAATGIIAVAAVWRWREHQRLTEAQDSPRDAQDVISDFNEKIHAIEERLTRMEEAHASNGVG